MFSHKNSTCDSNVTARVISGNSVMRHDLDFVDGEFTIYLHNYRLYET